MIEILQTVGVVVLGAAGVGAGWAFSRLKSKAWVIGYLVPLGAIVMIVLARRVPRLTLVPPFAWLMAGRLEYALFGTMAAMVLVTPLSRLKSRVLKAAVIGFMCFVLVFSSVLPFLQPLLIRGRLTRLQTRLDADGVCLQSTGYTCGPAAAVTALRRLGLDAEEGELAILSHTSAVAGTPADLLCRVLRRRYGSHGLQCNYRSFRSLDELREAGLVLAEVNLTIYYDHWVVVLDVTPAAVLVGDPLSGERTVPRDQFASMWRFTGIVVGRD